MQQQDQKTVILHLETKLDAYERQTRLLSEAHATATFTDGDLLGAHFIACNPDVFLNETTINTDLPIKLSMRASLFRDIFNGSVARTRCLSLQSTGEHVSEHKKRASEHGSMCNDCIAQNLPTRINNAFFLVIVSAHIFGTVSPSHHDNSHEWRQAITLVDEDYDDHNPCSFILWPSASSLTSHAHTFSFPYHVKFTFKVAVCRPAQTKHMLQPLYLSPLQAYNGNMFSANPETDGLLITDLYASSEHANGIDIAICFCLDIAPSARLARDTIPDSLFEPQDIFTHVEYGRALRAFFIEPRGTFRFRLPISQGRPDLISTPHMFILRSSVARNGVDLCCTPIASTTASTCNDLLEFTLLNFSSERVRIPARFMQLVLPTFAQTERTTFWQRLVRFDAPEPTFLPCNVQVEHKRKSKPELIPCVHHSLQDLGLEESLTLAHPHRLLTRDNEPTPSEVISIKNVY